MSKSTKPAFVQMSFDNWVETFNPISNTITPDAPFDGSMFETFGADLAEVLIWADGKHRHLQVWSLVEGDDGDLLICDGYHRVNRIGYFLTNVPAIAGTQYEIAV